MSEKQKIGCGSITSFGHGEGAICGKPFYNGIYECTDCKVKRLEKQRDELLAVAKQIYEIRVFDSNDIPLEEMWPDLFRNLGAAIEKGGA